MSGRAGVGEACLHVVIKWNSSIYCLLGIPAAVSPGISDMIRSCKGFGSIRGLIALVVFVAIALWSWDLWSSHARYVRAAATFGYYERTCREILSDPEREDRELWGAFPYSTDREWNRKLLSYSAKMRKRFEYAASHPWIRAKADPPPK